MQASKNSRSAPQRLSFSHRSQSRRKHDLTHDLAMAASAGNTLRCNLHCNSISDVSLPESNVGVAATNANSRRAHGCGISWLGLRFSSSAARTGSHPVDFLFVHG